MSLKTITDAARARANSAKVQRRRVVAVCMVCGAGGPVVERRLAKGWSWHPTGPRELAVCPRHTQAIERQRRIEALTDWRTRAATDAIWKRRQEAGTDGD